MHRFHRIIDQRIQRVEDLQDEPVDRGLDAVAVRPLAQPLVLLILSHRPETLAVVFIGGAQQLVRFAQLRIVIDRLFQVRNREPRLSFNGPDFRDPQIGV